MYKQKHILQEQLIDADYPRGCGFSNEGGSNLDEMLDSARIDDEYLGVTLSSETGVSSFDYDRYICKVNDIQNGGFSSKYPNIEFTSMKKESVYSGRYYTKTSTCFSYHIYGRREHIKQFLMNERNYSSSEFENKYITKLSIANQNITKIVTMDCHPSMLSDLRVYLKVLKQLTVTPEIEMTFSKYKSDKSFLTQKLGFKHSLNIRFTGKKCEVDSIVNLLISNKDKYLKKQKNKLMVEAI